MKKFALFLILLLAAGCVSLSVSENVSAESVFSREEAVRAHFALKREKLSEIVAKKRALIEESILMRIREQEKVKEEKANSEAAAVSTPEPEQDVEAVSEMPDVSVTDPETEVVTSASVVTGATQVVTGASRH